MIWADGDDSPVQLIFPMHSWQLFAIYCLLVLAACMVIAVVGAAVIGRIRYGHWPWRTCPDCEDS